MRTHTSLIGTRERRGVLLRFTATLPAVLFLLSRSPLAAQELGPDQGALRVMTYNVNEGTDFIEVESASTMTQFLIAVGQTISNVRATNPVERMQAVAQQILDAKAMLVSLQELDQWATGTFNPTTSACEGMHVETDMLSALLTSLAAQGGHYRLVVGAQQFAFPPTPGLILPDTFVCVAVVNENAILARTDLNPEVFQIDGAQSGQFTNRVLLATPIGTVPIPRAWEAVDAHFHHHALRFIGTHLEADDAQIRELQGGELRAGPANTSGPVIVAMDSNAQAFPLPPDPTYTDFLMAGYQDVWSVLFSQNPGLTCCQAPLDDNPVSQLTTRIDLILTRGAVHPLSAALFGADPASMTPDGLWPSDHAGVAARVQIAVEKE